MICEKCGYQYEGDTCSVCEAVSARKLKLKNKKTPFGIIGMIISILSCGIKIIVPFAPSIPISIISIVFSIIGISKNKRDGFGIAGICISSTNIVLRIIAKAANIILDIFVTALVLVFLLFVFFVILGLISQTPMSDVDSVF